MHTRREAGLDTVKRGDLRAKFALHCGDELVHSRVRLHMHEHRYPHAALLAHHAQVVADQVHNLRETKMRASEYT